MWKFLNLWFVFHQSQPHVFAVSTEGASLACYNFFLALAQTELALFMAILSIRKAISGVAFSAQAYFTARRPAPFQVVNLMIRRGKKKKLFFLMCFVSMVMVHLDSSLFLGIDTQDPGNELRKERQLPFQRVLR